MITDFLLDHSALVPGALALVALVCVAVGYAGLRLDRPGVVGIGASAAIEVVQAVVPAIDRACDTDDRAMNSLAVLTGALAARGLQALTATTTAAR